MRDTVIFVASKETIGDRQNLSSMDFFHGIQYPHLSLLIPYLKKLGLHTKVFSWEEDIDIIPDNEKIILGPVWGYTQHFLQFRKWLEILAERETAIINHTTFLRWNMDKKYLLELKECNIPIPDSLFIEGNSPISLVEAISLFQRDYRFNDIILKGKIDACGFGYHHLNSKNRAYSEAHFEKLKLRNGGAIIQNFIPEIYKKGELSFVLFRGYISHFYVRVPNYNQERVQSIYGGKSFHLTLKTISQQLIKIKKDFRRDIALSEDDIIHALEKIPAIYNSLQQMLEKRSISPPYFLRIDGVVINTIFHVMEIEGIEPYLEMKEAMIHDPSNNVVERYVKEIILSSKHP